jgi:K+-sensing histidine kinase KdpD
VIDAHAGSISADNREGGGLCAMIALPLTAAV